MVSAFQVYSNLLLVGVRRLPDDGYVGTSFGGIFMPFLCTTLLEKYNERTTLRILVSSIRNPVSTPSLNSNHESRA